MKSGLTVALKAILEQSGAHEKPAMLNSLPLLRSLPADGALRASATSIVQRWLWLYSLRTTSKSPRCSLRSLTLFLSVGAVVKAIDFPSGDQSKLLTPFSLLVS